ncbi:MAG TPA: glycosyltransferase, partial [Geminicoccaceae bacterium]
HNEGLPMAVLEALSHGIAVVATPVGAVPDAIVDGESGLLVPAGDAPALAAALARVIADPGLRRSLGDHARARFDARFSIPAHVDRLARIYADVRAGRADRAEAARRGAIPTAAATGRPEPRPDRA